MERRKVLQSHYRAVLDRTMRCWWITLRCVTAKPDCQLATVKFSVMDHRRTSVRVTDKPAFFFAYTKSKRLCRYASNVTGDRTWCWRIPRSLASNLMWRGCPGMVRLTKTAVTYLQGKSRRRYLNPLRNAKFKFTASSHRFFKFCPNPCRIVKIQGTYLAIISFRHNMQR